MKIVLDTNVLIAAFITRGVCSDVLEHCVRRHVLVTSEFILNEFCEKLIHKFKYNVNEAEEAVELLRSQMEMVIPARLGTAVCRDPDDDTILGTAIAGEAACIITGDKDLLVIKQFRVIDIVHPSEFAEYEAASLGSAA
ncbi:MAG: putative toxin-antitoxin system toxin component, PIN family [Deltaproteobacteria bacterium]|nr:MAG: putative toxin-antitoxin system toxin component, PIN family [Deltaproteobacteria bacterium]